MADSLAKSVAASLQKRDFDPGVGTKGFDRDKLSASDFAGKDRSFPIHSPEDVTDAMRSIGRARGQSKEAIKRRIRAIAHRKGPAYVAKLPDDMKKSVHPVFDTLDWLEILASPQVELPEADAATTTA